MEDPQIEYDNLDSVTEDGVLVGSVHYCPVCFLQLQLNDFPGAGETHWLCPSCGWWDTQELISIMMSDE